MKHLLKIDMKSSLKNVFMCCFEHAYYHNSATNCYIVKKAEQI